MTPLPPFLTECQSTGAITCSYFMQVDQEWSCGNQQRAYNASRMARGWGIAGIITGTLFFVFFLVVLPVVLPLSIIAAV